MEGKNPKPINNYILIQIIKEGEKTETGLIIPEKKGERTESYAKRARIIAVPTEYTDTEHPLEVSGGELVFVAKWELHHAPSLAGDFAFIQAKDILGIIPEA